MNILGYLKYYFPILVNVPDILYCCININHCHINKGTNHNIILIFLRSSNKTVATLRPGNGGLWCVPVLRCRSAGVPQLGTCATECKVGWYYVYTQCYIYIYTYVYIHMYIYIHIDMCIYIYMYVCMYICMYV